MGNRRPQGRTAFKVDFFSIASGAERLHRSRYYTTSEGMLRAGARWENRGSDYYCRYWSGLSTWQSAKRVRLVGDCEPRPPRKYTPRGKTGRRFKTQFFSVFGQCEAVAAEIMIKEGKIRRIPQDEIPLSQMTNEHGDVARFAIIVPGEHLHAYEELIKDIRA